MYKPPTPQTSPSKRPFDLYQLIGLHTVFYGICVDRLIFTAACSLSIQSTEFYFICNFFYARWISYFLKNLVNFLANNIISKIKLLSKGCKNFIAVLKTLTNEKILIDGVYNNLTRFISMAIVVTVCNCLLFLTMEKLFIRLVIKIF